MPFSDPFGPGADNAALVLETLSTYAVPLPEKSAGPVILDLGADERCPAGMQIARRDFEQVIGGLRLLLLAMDEPAALICAGTCFKDEFRLLRRLLDKGGALRPVAYGRRAAETSFEALERRFGPARVLTAELCRAAFRAVYEEEKFESRLVSVCFSGGTSFVRAPFGATTAEILQEVAVYPTPAVIVAGDLLQGEAVTDIDAPLADSVNALQILTRRELPEESPCIRCGACMNICPQKLLPWKFASGQNADFSACLDCGACTYFCPALQPLSLRIAQTRQEVAV